MRLLMRHIFRGPTAAKRRFVDHQRLDFSCSTGSALGQDEHLVKDGEGIQSPNQDRNHNHRAQHRRFDFFVGNAVVIGNPSSGRLPQLIEDLA